MEINTSHKKAIKMLEATVGIESNTRRLLPEFPLPIKVESLLTDFQDIKEIPYSAELDGYISIEEDASHEASLKFSIEKVAFKGPFIRLSEETSDPRFTLWGNQGFLFRYLLYLLEKKHKIFNFHGCALYQNLKNRIYLIIGGAGSGKTVYLLSGLALGLELFSTEIIHYRVENRDITWFMGSLVDNVRAGTLRHNFPQFMIDLELTHIKNEWQKKIAIDLSAYKSKKECITNPEVVIIFPRIEEGRNGFLFTPMINKKKITKLLFDNISQKLTETVILYDTIPLLGFDDQIMALSRLNSVVKLVNHENLKKVASVLSNPYECWGDILE
ncbi:MAG: hypothetical protein ACETWK_07035 [Candidatus Aminicenantaceae bacterium]